MPSIQDQREWVIDQCDAHMGTSTQAPLAWGDARAIIEALWDPQSPIKDIVAVVAMANAALKKARAR